MSFTERLAKQLEQAPQRVLVNLTTPNAQKKQYEWHKESNQKRSIR